MRGPQYAGLVLVGLVVACGGGEPAGPTAPLDWPTATPAEVGLDPARLADAVAHIEADLPNLDALLIVRAGRLAVEEYFHGTDRATLHLPRSITKSVTGAMAGIARARGWIDSVAQPVHTLLPTDLAATLTAAQRTITVEHLLTMSSGLDIEARGGLGPADDWVRLMLAQPLWTTPGSAWRYDSANPHLLSAIISFQTGFSMEDAAEEFLFGPLGITAWTWPPDPQGFSNGSTGLYLAAQDLAKLGELYLRDGRWGERQVLPSGWAAASTTARVTVDPATGYGYQWWVFPASRLGTPAWLAIGFREQYVIVLPAFDMVVVLASESITLRGPETDHLHVVRDYVIPAAGG